MNEKTLRNLSICGVVGFLLVVVIVAAVHKDSESAAHEMPSGTYLTTKSGAGANSLDNLVQMDECIKNSDQACESAMLLDGRAFFVEKGTSLDGEEIGYGVFEGRVRSGALVGKEIYIPVG